MGSNETTRQESRHFSVLMQHRRASESESGKCKSAEEDEEVEDEEEEEKMLSQFRGAINIKCDPKWSLPQALDTLYAEVRNLT